MGYSWVGFGPPGFGPIQPYSIFLWWYIWRLQNRCNVWYGILWAITLRHRCCCPAALPNNPLVYLISHRKCFLEVQFCCSIWGMWLEYLYACSNHNGFGVLMKKFHSRHWIKAKRSSNSQIHISTQWFIVKYLSGHTIILL